MNTKLKLCFTLFISVIWFFLSIPDTQAALCCPLINEKNNQAEDCLYRGITADCRADQRDAENCKEEMVVHGLDEPVCVEYYKIGKPEQCLSRSVCIKRMPEYKQASMSWGGPDFGTIALGDSKSIEIDANTWTGYTGTPEVRCLECDGTSMVMNEISKNGLQTKVSLEINTLAYKEKHSGERPPYKGAFRLISVAQKDGNNVYSYKEIPFTISAVDCLNTYNKDTCSNNKQYCFVYEEKCQSRLDVGICNKILTKEKCGPDNPEGSKVCTWNDEAKRCLDPTQTKAASNYEVPEGYVGALPDCAFSGNCRDVNDLLQLVINFGKGLFAIIGTFAFAFFVFGGFTMITSFGNAEKIKKGRDILIAAVTGLVIAFSAYLLVDFMLDALQVKEAFRVIGS